MYILLIIIVDYSISQKPVFLCDKSHENIIDKIN